MRGSIMVAMIVLLSVLAGNAQDQVIRDPHAEKVALDGPFHAVQVSSAIECYISQGEEESLALSVIPETLREYVLVTTDKGVLKIRMDENKKWRASFRNQQVKVYVSFKRLDQVWLTGASQLKFMGGVKADRLAIECSGASDIKGTVQAKQLSLELSGASRASIKGTANDLEIKASGASDFNGFDISAQNCVIDASGASNIRVNVQEAMDILATGASSVDYKGEPRLRSVKTSGASSLHRKS